MKLKLVDADSLSDIRSRVSEELSDPRFENCRHGRRHTANQGCRGPLCAWSNRVYKRQQLARRGKGVIPATGVDKYLEAWVTQINIERDAAEVAKQSPPSEQVAS
jgi:hypothetical protein